MKRADIKAGGHYLVPRSTSRYHRDSESDRAVCLSEDAVVADHARYGGIHGDAPTDLIPTAFGCIDRWLSGTGERIQPATATDKPTALRLLFARTDDQGAPDLRTAFAVPSSRVRSPWALYAEQAERRRAVEEERAAHTQRITEALTADRERITAALTDRGIAVGDLWSPNAQVHLSTGSSGAVTMHQSTLARILGLDPTTPED